MWTMMRLLSIGGIILAFAALVPLWFAIETHEDLQRDEAETDFLIVQGRPGSSSRTSAVIREQKMAILTKDADQKRTQRNVNLGVAVCALVVGIGLAFVAALKAPKKSKGKPSEPNTAPANIGLVEGNDLPPAGWKFVGPSAFSGVNVAARKSQSGRLPPPVC
jgi:hypothetical protein